MAVNKVIINGTTRIDLTGDTVDAGKIMSGYKAHDASGVQITGTLVPGITPTGIRTVTANGTYDVTSYANCTVAIPYYDGW